MSNQNDDVELLTSLLTRDEYGNDDMRVRDILMRLYTRIEALEKRQSHTEKSHINYG